MKAEQVVNIAAAMRMAQRHFFITKDKAALRQAKELEARFDAALLQYMEARACSSP